jgi:ribosome-associated translation inhibitor RaiA
LKILINTDNNIEGKEELNVHFKTVLENALSRFSDQIIRVEVYLGDENAYKKGSDDKRCTLEAHLGGLPPIVVVRHAANLEQAVNSAVDKLKESIGSAIGKRRNY